MKLFQDKKTKFILKVIFLTIYIFLVSSTTSYNNYALFDANVSTYVANHNMTNDKFIHTKIVRAPSEDSGFYNYQANKLVNGIKTDFTTYTSYLTFEKPEIEKFDLENDVFDIKFTTRVLNLNFRQDINRTFLETIRLRQYKIDIDSRYIESGFDFSFYISSIMADKIISQSNGMFTNYDEILDHDNHGLNFSINVDGTLKTGHIRNIYFIEKENEVSISLYKNLQDFIVFYGPGNEVFEGYNQTVNYDFLATSSSIKNNLVFLNEVEFGKVKFFDPASNNESEQLTKIINLLNNTFDYTLIQVIGLILLILNTLVLIFWIIRNRQGFYNKSSLFNVSVLLALLFFYHLIIKILGYFVTTRLCSYLLSNTIFGFLTISCYFVGILYYLSYYSKVAFFKKSKCGNLNL